MLRVESSLRYRINQRARSSELINSPPPEQRNGSLRVIKPLCKTPIRGASRADAPASSTTLLDSRTTSASQFGVYTAEHVSDFISHDHQYPASGITRRGNAATQQRSSIEHTRRRHSRNASSPSLRRLSSHLPLSPSIRFQTPCPAPSPTSSFTSSFPPRPSVGRLEGAGDDRSGRKERRRWLGEKVGRWKVLEMRTDWGRQRGTR